MDKRLAEAAPYEKIEVSKAIFRDYVAKLPISCYQKVDLLNMLDDHAQAVMADMEWSVSECIGGDNDVMSCEQLDAFNRERCVIEERLKALADEVSNARREVLRLFGVCDVSISGKLVTAYLALNRAALELGDSEGGQHEDGAG